MSGELTAAWGKLLFGRTFTITVYFTLLFLVITYGIAIHIADIDLHIIRHHRFEPVSFERRQLLLTLQYKQVVALLRLGSLLSLC